MYIICIQCSSLMCPYAGASLTRHCTADSICCNILQPGCMISNHVAVTEVCQHFDLSQNLLAIAKTHSVPGVFTFYFILFYMYLAGKAVFCKKIWGI